jgi:glucose/arabinose dehydrogenase
VRRHVFALTTALVAALVPGPVVAADGVITTVALTFVPGDVTVRQGDGLVYRNLDAFDHDVAAVQRGADGKPLFASDVISTGGESRVTGVEALPAGTYDFICRLHASSMQGTLTVTGPVSQTPKVALTPLPGAFQLPVAIAQQPNSDDLYIVEKTGRIRALRDGLVLDPVPVLDVSSEVSSGLEQGLLGLAFSPDGKFIYVNLTDAAGDTHILEFAFANGVAVPSSRRELFSVDQPFANHNGGTLMFGPDGYLYIALGDGGSGGDPGYRAQTLSTRLGKMLRIDPRPSGGAPYTVPADNPFVPDPDGASPPPPGALPEIWAYGLRNPWKFSFDRATGDLWIGDVGQDTWEEVNRQPAGSAGGQNYGWNHMEGLALYDGRPTGAVEPANHTRPIHVYGRDGGACSVTGGYVYRGSSASLRGSYVFADWCDGKLRYLRQANGQVTESGELGVVVPSITAFGEDHDGELYAISLGGTIFKIVPLP